MKKFRNIILAGIAAMGAFACTELEMTQYDYSNAVAPVLYSINVQESYLTENGTFGTLSFSLADYGFSAAAKYQAFVDLSDDFSAEKSISSAISMGASTEAPAISIKSKDLNNVLISKGIEAGTDITVYFRIKSVLQGETAAVAGAEGVLVSNSLSAVAVPYQAEKEYAKVWLPGSSNGWSHEVAEHLFNFAEDDKTFEGVTFFGDDPSANQFKLTGAAGWDNETGNWGVADPSAEAESKSLQLLNGSNDNITQYTAHKYYHFTFDKSSLILKMDYGFDQVGVIGLGGDWSNDIVMLWDNYKQRFYVDVDIASATEFKYRLDGGWDVNWGGDLDGLTNGGDNIAIEAGQYRIYLNLNQSDKITGGISADDYGKSIGPDTPPTPPAPYEGWGVVGSINGWGGDGGDVHMTVMGDYWVARAVTLTADDQFKFRKDEDWAENIGAEGDVEPFVVTGGEKYTGAAGGKNLGVPAEGKYDLYVNPTELTFYVMAEGEVPGELATWGVVGTINSWGGSADLAMSPDDNGMLVRRNVALTTGDQIKVRYQNNWDVNRGAPGDVEPFIMGSDAIQAVPGGKNLGVPADGEYDVWYDEANEVLFVVPAGEALQYWGVVGNLTNWGGDPDFIMYKEGDFYVHKGIAFSTEHQFKIRYQSNWDVNRGAPGDVEPFKVDANSVLDATQNGKNLGVNEDGMYDVWYNATTEKLYVMAEGTTPDDATEPEQPEPTAPDTWGIVGAFTGWGEDADIAMTKDGDWFYATGVSIEAGSGWKLRGDSDWTFNRGAEGDVEPFAVTVGEALTVIQGGKNLTVSETGTYDVYYDSANEKLYVMSAGDAPADYHSYAEYIYAIGGDTGWSSVYYLSSSKDGDAFTGKYKGFGWLSGEFKFKPNENDWSGDWEFDGEGKIADNGGSNCPAPATAGYYMIEVDLTAMTYSLTLINGIGVIGPAQAGGWDSDTDLAYDSESGLWKGTVELAAGEYKFRANDAWDINWGGDLAALTQGGGNINLAEAGTYAIELAALCDGKAYATVTKQ